MAKKMKGQERPMLSRRAWIGRLSTLAGLVLLTKRGAAATTTQTTKAAAHYQDSPNAGQMCGMCKFFIPPGGKPGSGMMGGTMGPGMMSGGTCQLVEGRINPMGWCQLYGPLSG
ncbi:MAG: high-potential iron-sulfur protein [Acidibrevibacterium sp.]|uniref:high-potential iron-sulfur protein n=1 Tax=Acidibrevibacterium fodinaquatile TaxID=1969806 RepID=UPI001962BB17|nr:high-potential iron-sulfur protein [Acidibrevibacterium fodinaquatile]MCA7118360.1 high-potential iron-sulfur protein [Acidibrevibacterium fodinaquatile]